MSKRLLLVGHGAVDVSMGGVRLRRLARLLPRYGWDPVVLTHPPEKSLSGLEELRLEAVAAADLTALYQKMRRLGRSHPQSSPAGRQEPTVKTIGLTSKLNRWVMIPDKQVTWYRAAVRRGLELLRGEQFDLIFASLEPRTNLLVAARLARASGLPCIMEYRDLWTANPYYHQAQPTPLHRWVHSALERRALRRARRVSAVCRGIADYLTQRYGAVLPGPIELNYNFFDPEEYPALAPESGPARPFTISYTGAMYGQRSPHQFFEGMRAFIEQAGLTSAQFRFRWAGAIAGIEGLSEVLDRNGVRPYMDFLGQIPHQDALRLLRQSEAALLLQAPGDAIHIPGKLFEAMGARVPLLALAHPCEVTDILTRCRAGIICPHTAASVAAALGQLYERFRQQQRWDFNEAEVQRFSAEAAVSRLAGFFDQTVAA